MERRDGEREGGARREVAEVEVQKRVSLYTYAIEVGSGEDRSV